MMKKMKHPYKGEKSDSNQGRANANRDLYGSNQWRKLSERVRAEEPLCRECLKEDRLTPSKVADHIVPVNNGGQRYDRENLQALCIECHNRKSGKEGSGR